MTYGQMMRENSMHECVEWFRPITENLRYRGYNCRHLYRTVLGVCIHYVDFTMPGEYETQGFTPEDDMTSEEYLSYLLEQPEIKEIKCKTVPCPVVDAATQ